MKIAIISDTHFGDDQCTLVKKNGSSFVIGSRYKDFVNAVGQDNDYLVLAGDILDFSIAGYEIAYEYARFFFQQVKNDGIAQEMIYLAGNHDADIWHIIQHQRSVINKIKKGILPESFKHSTPGIIDDRSSSPKEMKGFTLYDTTVQSMDPTTGKRRYGGMFLDKITTPETIFNFAYPNLYIVTDNETVLVTHGQYLELYWCILGEIATKVAYDDLKVGEVDVEELIEMNFPLNQLACTGIGQAGVLTKVVRQLEVDVKRKDIKRVRKYLDRLENIIDDLTHYGWLKEIIVDYIIRKAKEQFLDAIGSIEQTRYSEEFIYKPEVMNRFRAFYNNSLLEIGDINSKANFNMPAPWRIIFGHTHEPISWTDPNPPKLDSVSSASPKRLTLHNTGGWLEDKGEFCGAEVFIYESGKGFSSQSIR
jgi:UDP-2,3-diacylglucosamine pyrophosphatase LpxH